MNTPIEAGLYQDERGRVCEIQQHPEEGRGWLAFAVSEIIRHAGTDGLRVEVLRAKTAPMRVTLEFWALLKPFYVEPVAPLVKTLGKVIAAVQSANAPARDDGAVSA